MASSANFTKRRLAFIFGTSCITKRNIHLFFFRPFRFEKLHFGFSMRLSYTWRSCTVVCSTNFTKKRWSFILEQATSPSTTSTSFSSERPVVRSGIGYSMRLSYEPDPSLEKLPSLARISEGERGPSIFLPRTTSTTFSSEGPVCGVAPWF